MSYDYRQVLNRLRDARSKRKKCIFTKRFVDTLRREHLLLPTTDLISRPSTRKPVTAADDGYSQSLLRLFGPTEAERGRVPKQVSSDGNCLFNAASVALTGKNCL